MPKCYYGCGQEGKYFNKRNGRWRCENHFRKCINYRKKYFQKTLNIINKMGGECLSTINDYDNNHSSLKIKCKCKKIWKTTGNSLRNGIWCPRCGIKKSHEKLSDKIEMLHEKAKENGGKCLSDVYINNSTRYEWECGYCKREFSRTWNEIKHGKWCSRCSACLTENMCRFILEQLLNKEFIKTRKLFPPYEIDGYCEELEIGFEYNGEQHYKENNYFRKNRSLKNQQKRDRKIKKLFKDNNIKLIIISYKYSNTKEQLEKYIKNKLSSFGIQISTSANWSEFKYGKNELEELKKIIEEKGGKLLSKSYFNAKTPLEISCGNSDHPSWMDIPPSIKRGNWCPYCSNHKVCLENCLATKKPEIAKEWHPTKNGNLTPFDVAPGSGKRIWWICDKLNHEWESTINNRLSGYGCPECKNIKHVIKSKGVNFLKNKKRYIARLSKVSLGSYVKEQDAIKIRKQAVDLYEAGERDPEVYKKLKEDFQEKLKDMETKENT